MALPLIVIDIALECSSGVIDTSIVPTLGQVDYFFEDQGPNGCSIAFIERFDDVAVDQQTVTYINSSSSTNGYMLTTAYQYVEPT